MAGAASTKMMRPEVKMNDAFMKEEWTKAGRSQMEETLSRTLIFNLKSIRNL